MTEALVQALVEMKEAEALQRAQHLLVEGTEPLEILESCSMAMEMVGQRFEKGVYFLPHLMMAGEMLRQISSLIKPLIQEQKAGNKGGKVIFEGTPKQLLSASHSLTSAYLTLDGWIHQQDNIANFDTTSKP